MSSDEREVSSAGEKCRPPTESVDKFSESVVCKLKVATNFQKDRLPARKCRRIFKSDARRIESIDKFLKVSIANRKR
jgi:hypothetical protein